MEVVTEGLLQGAQVVGTMGQHMKHPPPRVTGIDPAGNATVKPA